MYPFKNDPLLNTRFSDFPIEAGCDEAGRGCLAGPVFAAAVILPTDFHPPDLNDSKLLTSSQRNELRQLIETHAVSWAVSMSMPNEIDDINILRASFRAMERALLGLKNTPEFVIIDGDRFHSELPVKYECIIGGDSQYASIAAASILAKTHRDEYMEKLHEEYPVYNWNSNKGYATLFHRKAIIRHGRCPHHRKTFRVQVQTTLFD